MGSLNIPSREAITGLLLAGGMGRRMGGVDKGLVTISGQAMAAWALARLRPQVGDVLINANRSRDQWQAFGDPVVGDVIAGYAGPLAGIHAGLGQCRRDWMLTVPCDSPCFPMDLASRLAQAAGAAMADLAVARAEGRIQPVFALMRRTVLPSLALFLAGDGRRVDQWFESLAIVEVDFPDAAAFANINTPEELATLHATEALSK